MSKRLVITEKPSVARDIAKALGGFDDEGEYLESERWVLTWAVGHLLELEQPEAYDKQLRSWSVKLLPIIPDAFKLKPIDGQKKRLMQIRKLGRRKDVEGIVNACDAGREGELIFRRIVEWAEFDEKAQQRLWLQSMTPAAIRLAFDNLKPGSDYDKLGDAAFLRSIGDWLIGMNATRALTQRLKSRGEQGSWSAGRVQTPTLAILVAREREILAHVPRPYWELEATFTKQVEGKEQRWVGRWFDPNHPKSDDRDLKPTRLFDKERVERVVEGVKAATGGVASEKRRKSKQKPPLLFDLTSLQREANRRYSISAKRTLDAAQRLYEVHKVLTYPRTDSRYLPGDYAPTVAKVLDAVASYAEAGVYGEHAAHAKKVVREGPQNLERILDDSKVSDHFAIVPTGGAVKEALTGDDARIFDLVLRQFIAALMGPATWAVVERIVRVAVEGEPSGANFRTTTRSLEVPGFLAALGQEADLSGVLPALVPGSDKVDGVAVQLDELAQEGKETKPPPRYTEAQLLRMMETAGELIRDDEDLSDAMRERGLGTPATRADTIERLVRAKSPYARRVSGRLGPTHKGMRLLDVLERVNAQLIASPKLTGEWEHTLKQVEQGGRKRGDIQKELSDYTRSVTELLKGFEHDQLFAKEPSLGVCPECGSKVRESAWGYPCEQNTGKDSPCGFMVWKDRYGRFMDRGLVARLIDEKTVGPIGGFVDQAGRNYLEATLTLKRDEDKGRWVVDVQFGDAPDEEPEVIGQALWPCPEYEGAMIVETSHRYVTDRILSGETKKGPVLPKIVCHREMGLEEAADYFGEKGKTEILEGFISRRGRPFRGAVKRKPTGKHGFEFPPRAPREGAKKAAGKKAAATKKAATKKKTTAKKKTAASKKAGVAAKKATAAKKSTKSTASKKASTRKTSATKKASTSAAKKSTTTTKGAKTAAKRATAAKKAASAKPRKAKSTSTKRDSRITGDGA